MKCTRFQWFNSKDPEWLFSQIASISDSQARLLAVAIARLIRCGNEKHWRVAEIRARGVDYKPLSVFAYSFLHDDPLLAASHVMEDGWGAEFGRNVWVTDRTQADKAEIIRSILSYHTLPAETSWCENCRSECFVSHYGRPTCSGRGSGVSSYLDDPDVARLAQVAFRDRADDGQLNQDTLTVLSDALESAGMPAETMRGCEGCDGWSSETAGGHWACGDCNGKGHRLYPNLVLEQLRAPGLKYRGLWSLEWVRKNLPVSSDNMVRTLQSWTNWLAL